MDAIKRPRLTLDHMDGIIAWYAELVEDDAVIKYAHKVV